MNIKGIIKFKKTDYGEVGINISNFWKKSYKLVFFMFFLAVAFWGSYLCYAFLFNSTWSESKKNAYNNSQSKSVEFKEDDFQKLVDLAQKRRDNYSAPHQPIKNIFQPYE
jgi:hypothetical protein